MGIQSFRLPINVQVILLVLAEVSICVAAYLNKFLHHRFGIKGTWLNLTPVAFSIALSIAAQRRPSATRQYPLRLTAHTHTDSLRRRPEWAECPRQSE
jgi:hypothetical protein